MTGMNSKHNEPLFYIAIGIFVVAFWIAACFFPIDPLVKVISTTLALISAVAFWLQFKRQERLNESSYIMNLNNQFIGNKDMTQVEHELELYFNQYEAVFGNSDRVSLNEALKIGLGLSQSRTGDDCQKLINYLVYLEALAALIDQNVLHLRVIDDLFSYRFFLAVNNPIVQLGELFPYAEYYRGIYKLSERWIKKHSEKGIPIPMSAFCLTEKARETWMRHPEVPLDVSTARGNDRKLEIAGCLYDTDPYIYPEAFGENKESASKTLSRIVGMDGSLLDYKYMLVARYNREVCGVCLVSDGKGKWDTEAIAKRIGPDRLPAQYLEGFNHASEEYFGKLYHPDQKADSVELVALCVNEGFRRKRVATALMDGLINEYGSRIIVLTVLADNEAAISLYKKFGFRIRATEEPVLGFAPEGLQKPVCYIMERFPSAQSENVSTRA